MTVRAPGFAATCPRCSEFVSPGLTVCECGARLFPSVPDLLDARDAGRPHCTCGGNNICTFCVIGLMDEGKAL